MDKGHRRFPDPPDNRIMFIVNFLAFCSSVCFLSLAYWPAHYITYVMCAETERLKNGRYEKKGRGDYLSALIGFSR